MSDKVDAASCRVSHMLDSFHYFDPEEPIDALSGGNLPHWRQESVIYFVTFRLSDSLPEEKLCQWVLERDTWLRAHPLPHSRELRRQYYDLFPARCQHWLDQGHGCCLPAHPEWKGMVENASGYFDGRRYELDEFTVMPNHVHVLLAPREEHPLSRILHSWKSFTAGEINRRLGKSGIFWQKESFDPIVRSPASLERIRVYIRNNPKGTVQVDAKVDAASSRVSSAFKVDAASCRVSSAFEEKEKKRGTRQDAASTLSS